MREEEGQEEKEGEQKEYEFHGTRSHSTSGEPCVGGGGE